MKRITTSLITFVASQSAGAKVVSKILNLTDYIPATALALPTALAFSSDVTLNGALKVTEILLRSEKNPENVHRIVKTAAVPLNDLMSAFARTVTQGQALTPLHFAPDHGLEIEFTYESDGTVPAADSVLIWDIANQGPTIPIPGDPAGGPFQFPRGARPGEGAALLEDTPRQANPLGVREQGLNAMPSGVFRWVTT